MELKWIPTSTNGVKLIDASRPYWSTDTGWRVVRLRGDGVWAAYRPGYDSGFAEFKTEDEARAFAEPTYILESSNGA